MKENCMAKKNNDKNVAKNVFDIEDLKSESISVAVDGKTLPLKIGDAIEFDDDNNTVRTVMKIQVNETGYILYCFEWFDGAEFKSEWLSSAEVWHALKNMNKKNVKGFAS